MRYMKFGSTGITVSRLCLGTRTFGLKVDETTSHAILDRAAGNGVNFIDTSGKVRYVGISKVLAFRLAPLRPTSAAQCQRPNSTLAFTPPKPKPFEIACSMGMFNGAPVTRCTPRLAESGFSRFSVAGAI
jgi:hypothetical protein